MENKTNINCEKPIYINIDSTLKNTKFFLLRFLHFFLIERKGEII